MDVPLLGDLQIGHPRVGCCLGRLDVRWNALHYLGIGPYRTHVHLDVVSEFRHVRNKSSSLSFCSILQPSIQKQFQLCLDMGTNYPIFPRERSNFGPSSWSTVYNELPGHPSIITATPHSIAPHHTLSYLRAACFHHFVATTRCSPSQPGQTAHLPIARGSPPSPWRSRPRDVSSRPVASAGPQR